MLVVSRALGSVYLVYCLAGLGCGASAPTEPADDLPTGGSGSGGGGGQATTSAGAGGSVTATGGGGAASGGASGTGGTSGPAGASGTGGAKGVAGGAVDAGAVVEAGPHVVGKCDGLGAVGAWENITPPQVVLDNGDPNNFGVNCFVLDPQNSGTIYLGTSAQGIFKSTDCGATWVHINTGTSGVQLDKGRQWTMVIDPVDPQVIYTVAGYGTNGLFKTTNGGVDWKQIFPPDVAAAFIFNGFTARVVMDPTDHLHIVATPHFTCQGNHSMGCMLESEDGGTTWKAIENTPSAAEGTGVILLDRTTWLWADPFGGLWRTTDRGGSWKQVYKGNAWDSIYRQKNGTYLVSSAGQGVLESTDGISWTVAAHSHNSRGIIGDGINVYTSNDQVNNAKYQPYWFAPESDTTNWKQFASPPMTRGGLTLRYDPDHHLLYSTNDLAGFWRIVTN
jgi:hypothetical protein